jgi:hypothetical protein
VEESKREYGGVHRGAEPKIKAWPSRFEIGHKDEKLILEKNDNFENHKKKL